MTTKYIGCVTDISFIRAVLKLPFHERRKHFNYVTNEIEFNKGLDYVFSLKRLPRVYSDEIG